ncbi:polyphosphate kinase 1 [Chitinivibrio alkaliphilus]|uniref:Polyphosphate kinase n=1 Tax=Chitinivibrio alkaliphilus ACht1 TaxID=1313304 RepID=U7D300_9BACT|nr:polyphosphate kinase 1 [Chitinivibrio alkaliphilus]ERP30859.1 Polyphosphate kinase [Chitinivibrio alkaliphilus ACht1]
MGATSAFFNRELSQIAFNRRVLELAEDPTVPLMERLGFLAITANNQDEFCKVRLGSLMMLAEKNTTEQDRAGYTIVEQLNAAIEQSHNLLSHMDALYTKNLGPALAKEGIHLTRPPHLFLKQKEFFLEHIYPLLTPIAIHPERQPTVLEPERLHLLVRLKNREEEISHSIIPFPKHTERFLFAEQYATPLETILKAHCHDLFHGYDLIDTHLFYLIRNAGMNVDEDISERFLPHMHEIIRQRKRSFCTRLDVEEGIDPESRKVLTTYLGISRNDCVVTRSSFLKMQDVFSLQHFRKLKSQFFPNQPPLLRNDIRQCNCLFSYLSEKDILLIHPYESYDTVLRFIDEAAKDPQVTAVKQTLYRTSAKSPIIASLKEAAQRGKNVTVLCEIKARFDEAQNIAWAHELEDAGITVVYGVKHLKTHAKATLVIRKEKGGIARYAHFGTGNYNEKTARLYTDISLLTANPKLCDDAAKLFHVITGASMTQQFSYLRMAPIDLKKTLRQLIRQEASNAQKGGIGKIEAKVNSLSDPEIINDLYEASQKGVEIQLNVRGICLLRPQIANLSENITVISILGRYLEHARLFCFHANGSPRYYISSADWMPRNQERRIEHMVPILSKECTQKLRRYLDTLFSEHTTGWFLSGKDGTYARRKDQTTFDCQEKIYHEIITEYTSSEYSTPLLFDPHTARK